MSDKTPWSQSAAEVVQWSQTDAQTGLSTAAAADRLKEYGENVLETVAAHSPWKLFLLQFADLMIGLLAVAAVISAAIGEWADSVLIAVIVIANAVIGFLQEWRAEKAVEALKKLAQPNAQLWRDGDLVEIAAAQIVPGDVMQLSTGQLIPADARVIEFSNFEVDEAPLTGESLPVEKTDKPLAADAALPDRHCMVYSGTAIVQGRAKAVVTATGMRTELGKIATLLETAETTLSPLQVRLASLSKKLAVIVVVICLVVFAAGVLRENPEDWNAELFSTMLLTAVSLAVAAIPEGLPAIITVTLALGSQRMADRKAIVRRLSAVETLGSVDVICSDKTGTLTRNKMEVRDLIPVDDTDQAVQMLVEAGALCNDARPDESGTIIGSATESAILQAALDRDVGRKQLLASWPRLDEIPFSSSRKRMTTLHRGPAGELRTFTKGAVERIIHSCTHLGTGDARREMSESLRQEWTEKAEGLAARGRRVLAIATRDWDRDDLADEKEAAESGLSLLGIYGLIDPVRPEAFDSVAQCKSAGIRVVMITGDHQGTAAAIAEELKLTEGEDEVLTGAQLDRMDDEEFARRAPGTSVFARVSPDHKMRILQAIQAEDHVASMTGDGVNDAPALKQADIGVAMGVTGTDVAKEAADMILADDNFATIVAAVEEGRIVYDNIRKFVAYLLTANAGEILVLLLGILAGMPLPLLPVHILWINLVTDGLPAIALGFEPGEADLMRRQPRRRDESVFADGMVWLIVWIGLLMSLTCVTMYAMMLNGVWKIPVSAAGDVSLTYARTAVFYVLATAQLFYVLAVRSSSRTLLRLGLWSNYRLTVAVLLGFVLQLAAMYVAPLQKFFHTAAIEPLDLAICTVLAMLPFLAVEAWKIVRH